MDNFIPTTPELIKNLILTLSIYILTVAYNKYIKKIKISTMPLWVKQALFIYTFISVIFFTINLYKQYGPLKVRKNEIITNQKVILDGYSFLDCNLINDTLIVNGEKKFNMDRCTLVNPKFIIGGKAQVGLNVLSELWQIEVYRPHVITLLNDTYKKNVIYTNNHK